MTVYFFFYPASTLPEGWGVNETGQVRRRDQRGGICRIKQGWADWRSHGSWISYRHLIDQTPNYVTGGGALAPLSRSIDLWNVHP